MSRRRLLGFYLLGVVLLAGSVAGASFALHAQGSAASGGSEEAPAVASGEKPVICFGYVDTPGGVASVFPLLPGRVARIQVEEGQQVSKGDVLFEMDSTQAELKVKEARAAKEAAEAQLNEAENQAGQYSFEVDRQKKAVDRAKGILDAAEAMNQRAKRLSGSSISAEEARAAAANVEQARAGLEAEEIKLEELKQLKPQLKVELARKDLAVREAVLEEAEHAVTECRRTAPFEGTVLRVLANPGDVYSPQSHQPVLQFCPTGRRIVRAEVEQEFAGRVAKGQKASFQDDTTGQTIWHGKVNHVSDWFSQRRMYLPEPLQLHDVRTLECIIEIDPNQPPLRINQRVRVTIGR
jgi:HlyD family secretion protein